MRPLERDSGHGDERELSVVARSGLSGRTDDSDGCGGAGSERDVCRSKRATGRRPQGGAVNFDALPPREMAEKAEQAGVAKSGLDGLATFALAILAGAFIAMGAAFATTSTAGAADLPYGVVRLIAGATFSLGLILVVVAGAELFTGNNLIVMAWADRKVSTVRLLRNWTIVYAGNFVGAIGTAALVFEARQYEFGKGTVGAQALATAATKTGYGWWQALVLGILCNALVCLAVWLCYSARTVADKILAIVPPITAFVASGFEHSVANMYFLPYALLVKTDDAFVASTNGVPDLTNLTWTRFVGANLIPVTIGNILGGSLMVGAIYWFIYLRRRDEREEAGAPAPMSAVLPD
jgi:formate transporter